jgi:hypothetical protein
MDAFGMAIGSVGMATFRKAGPISGTTKFYPIGGETEECCGNSEQLGGKV